MTAGIGHNHGPTMEKGRGWRSYTWRKARADLLPKLPIEVLRLRVRRAKELGIDYKSYASIRASSGHDVVALLFSSNALRITPALPVAPLDRTEALQAIRNAGRLALVHPPLQPEQARSANPILEAADTAPGLSQSWAETAAHLRGFLQRHQLPTDRVVLVSETALERDWLSAGNLAGIIPADRYFA